MTPDRVQDHLAEQPPGRWSLTSDHKTTSSPAELAADGTRASLEPSGPLRPSWHARHRWLRRALTTSAVLLFLIAAAALGARLWLQRVARAAFPQIDGQLTLTELSGPVTVLRDGHGVPSIRAAALDDLVTAQAFVTAEDRLFQLDILRRHAAGELAEILGPGLLEHDRTQRILQMRAAADRALGNLPADQRHWLDRYASGVNAAIRLQTAHLPLEFRLLGYTPRPWLPRDSVLIVLVMYQDLTNFFPQKLDRESLIAHLDPTLPAPVRDQLLTDLYPVGSWRDHPPTQPPVDLTKPVDEIPDIPLDDSQTKLQSPADPTVQRSPSEAPPFVISSTPVPAFARPATTISNLLTLRRRLAPLGCPDCRAGSNNWVVAGAHTATGSPLLSNDMHLTLGVPGLWYQVDLSAPDPATPEPFHVAGVSLPGTPFVIVGHNAHVAWGFTNLGGDVQDLTIEHLRGSPGSPDTPTEFLGSDALWHPLLHQRETIAIRGKAPVTLDVLATLHGADATPIISPLLPSETRPISLHWTIYNPDNVSLPFFTVGSAPTGAALVDAFSRFGGPSQNLVYADDGGHIGYHAVGRIPVRGSLITPSPLSNVPVDAAAPDAATYEWAGYIPYDQLPQIADPPDGILATANARITPDDYRFPISADWPDPYRNERIWRLLTGRNSLTPADMLAIQTDIVSDPDRLIARRLAYALDHAPGQTPAQTKRRRQAADLLRTWDGRVTVNSPAAAITVAARAALWPLLLTPKLRPGEPRSPTPSSQTRTSTPPAPMHASHDRQPWELYSWNERAFAEEQIIAHTPARWLPPSFANWDDLLAAAVDRGLADSHAPGDLAKWHYGQAHPVDLEHPIFAQSWLLRGLIGLPTGTGRQPQSGDGTTIKQVGRTFGPSERFTASLADLDQSTLNLVLGESGNPASPWFLDQFPAWLHGTTFPMPFSDRVVREATAHTLVLRP